MAASVPHHYCFDYSSMPTDLCSEEISNIILNSSTNGGISNCNTVPLLNYDINSPVSVAAFPDSMLVPQMSEFDAYNQNQVFEPGEGFMVPTFCPPFSYSPMPAQDWAIQGKTAMKGDEGDQVKVGRYSVEERKGRILRYLKKRNQRNFNKTIKYACRKTLADKRVRVRGRFAKNNEPCQEETILMNSTDDDACYEQMMKYEEDYWLEAAIENLGQFPYLGS